MNFMLDLKCNYIFQKQGYVLMAVTFKNTFAHSYLSSNFTLKFNKIKEESQIQ